MKILLSVILSLIFLVFWSCSDSGEPILKGCMDMDACNYNPDASEVDDSCTYAEINYDCDGNCIAVEDCAGVCGGDSVLNGCDNACGSIAVEDCAGVCGGSAVLSGCDNTCGSIAVEDCADVCGGSAVLSGCDNACGSIAVEDCAGLCGGTTTLEVCDECSSLVFDCAGVCEGTSVVDECGVCGGNGIDATTACCANTGAGLNGEVADCAGECGGNAVEDCVGVCNGSAVLTDCGCGEADSDETTGCCADGFGPNDETPDCAGVCGGDSVLSGCDNACGSIAVEDCAGTCDGTAENDDCGFCSGDNSSCVNYSTEIQPIFTANCTSCHGGSGGLSLTSYSDLMGNDVVDPGNSMTSILIQRLKGTLGTQMPKYQDPLGEATINLIETWIDEGALDN